MNRIKETFAEALDRQGADLTAYLDKACADNPELRAKVEALLAAAAQTDAFRETATSSLSERPGTVIGRYKLLEQIGEGGFGVVFMAEQEAPIRRRVALKIIKLGMDTKQIVARFEAERQALAMMDHPNIAKVFDGGATEAGRLYFVMELVRGISITDYCDQHNLPVRRRLELFAQVCQAVQHAHQKGIIHRDLKPTNVLVADYDDLPVPKVIDFGVAKAIGEHLTEKTMFTQFGQIVGTIEYMSPEQAKLNQLDIDTRSDIYSLGVLLYQLLTGETPFDRQRLRSAAFDEMLRIIREEEPPKPSTRLSSLSQKGSGGARVPSNLASIAANRQSDPRKLSRDVQGELDWIVMKALEKDRNHRYETAIGLARDIQRYLADEAVEACPPTAGYKLRKFARKNRRVLATTGAFIILLVVGTVVSTWQAIRARHAEAAAIANARQARNETNAKMAALVAEQKAREDETKARQQAFAALRSMTADVVKRKFAQGTVLTEDDRAFLRNVIAQYDAFAAIKGDDEANLAIKAEGRYNIGQMQYDLGELKEAENDFDQALSLSQQLAADFPSKPEYRERVADCYCERGVLLRDMGRLPETEKDFDQALSLYQQLVAEFPSRTDFRSALVDGHANLAVVLTDRGQISAAEKEYSLALTIQRQLVADSHGQPELRSDLALVLLNQGATFRQGGQPEKAEQDESEALGVYKQLVADFPSRPQFRQQLALLRNNRGNLLNATSRPKEAEQEFNEALRLYGQLAADYPAQPENRVELARTHHCRAILLRETGRLTDAEQDDDRALGIQKELEADFPARPDLQNDLADTYSNLAILREKQGDWAAAKRLLLEGRPHHLAALKAEPTNSIYRQDYRGHLGELIQVYAELLEQEDAIRTAETLRVVGWDAPANTYDAACYLSRCIPIVSNHNALDEQQRKQAQQFYSDAAMKLLGEAVSKGYRDPTYMLKDADLEPLHQRDDFKKLIAELNSSLHPDTASPGRSGLALPNPATARATQP